MNYDGGAAGIVPNVQPAPPAAGPHYDFELIALGPKDVVCAALQKRWDAGWRLVSTAIDLVQVNDDGKPTRGKVVAADGRPAGGTNIVRILICVFERREK